MSLYFRYLCFSLAVISLTACGGGGGGSSPDAPPPVGGNNGAPVAVDDVGTVAIGGSVTIDVLANDSDPDGDPISVADITDPNDGSAELTVGTGLITYTPSVNTSGTDSFQYTVTDGNATATATVEITVIDRVVTVSGKVTLGNVDVSNAQVRITSTDLDQVVDVDANGNYSFQAEFGSQDDLVIAEATIPGQPSVKLVSVIGTKHELARIAGEVAGPVDESSLNDVNIHSLSTAMAGTVALLNDGQLPQDLETFYRLRESLVMEELVWFQVFVLSVAEANGYDLPGNATDIFAMLTNPESVTTLYNDLSNGSPIVGDRYSERLGNLDEFTSRAAGFWGGRENIYQGLTEDHDGYYFSLTFDNFGDLYSSDGTDSLSWEIANDGTLVIDYREGNNPVISFPAIGCSNGAQVVQETFREAENITHLSGYDRPIFVMKSTFLETFPNCSELDDRLAEEIQILSRHEIANFSVVTELANGGGLGKTVSMNLYTNFTPDGSMTERLALTAIAGELGSNDDMTMRFEEGTWSWQITPEGRFRVLRTPEVLGSEYFAYREVDGALLGVTLTDYDGELYLRNSLLVVSEQNASDLIVDFTGRYEYSGELGNLEFPTGAFSIAPDDTGWTSRVTDSGALPSEFFPDFQSSSSSRFHWVRGVDSIDATNQYLFDVDTFDFQGFVTTPCMAGSTDCFTWRTRNFLPVATSDNDVIYVLSRVLDPGGDPFFEIPNGRFGFLRKHLKSELIPFGED